MTTMTMTDAPADKSQQTAQILQHSLKPVTLLERSVCLVLDCGRQGNDRKVNLDAMEIKKDGEQLADAAKDELHSRKSLFARKDLRACNAVITAAQQNLRAISLDGGMRIFGDGTYLVPLLGVERAEQILAEAKRLLAEKVDELVALLPRLLEQRRDKLGGLFDVTEYPTADDIRSAYRIKWNYVSFGAPERLEEVHAAAYERAVSQHNANLRAAFDEAVLGVRAAAALVMRELVVRLGNDDEEKPKVLRPTALRDLQELLTNLPILNSVGEDQHVAAVLARVGVMAEGLDVETLRKAPAVRAMLLAEAEKAVVQLDQLVTTSRRAMALDGEF